ncbi:hypothetical protein CDCA_CDCA20G4846 [Cyanidium caldarium]|uniref:V-type proton ATPase subunit C n=1 Tax=Cyanidium caldarium TaxID=2771 RepID=A0AAV9J375_CYACA|nr:hypothetical protein CDCA_CDCA20G4846 [Cyanidium caldarium]
MPTRTYWLISVPQLAPSLERARVSRLELPAFRVGTLDALMALSDGAAKDDAAVSQLCHRIGKQFREIEDDGMEDEGGAEGLAVAEELLMRFRWNDAKYAANSSTPLSNIVQGIVRDAEQLERDLTARANAYANAKQELATVRRHGEGGLLTRSLADWVPAAQVLNTEHLLSLYVVVPRYATADFLNSYESLSAAAVVPRSATLITEDKEWALFSVVVLRRGAAEFRRAARERRYQVREYQHSNSNDNGAADGAPDARGRYEQLAQEVTQRGGQLRQWCRVAYTEATEALLHLKVVRLFVESVLRYGLPVTFEAACIQPEEKQEARVRQALRHRYRHLAFGYREEEEDGGGGSANALAAALGLQRRAAPATAITNAVGGTATDGIDGDGDDEPYVSFSLQLGVTVGR